MSDITQDATRDELGRAVDDMRGSLSAYTYDGARDEHDHVSGEPERRDLVLGDDDPRDAALAETPLSEDVAWTGRIFNVDRLQVRLPDGRKAVATWCATPAPSPSSPSRTTAASAWCASTAPRSPA